MTPAPSSRTIAIGFGVATVLCGLLLVASLWNPANCLPLALLFLVVAAGIRRHSQWHAFGGALLIAALVGTGALTMLRNGNQTAAAWWALLIPAGLLFLAGRAMRGSARIGSPAAWISLAVAVFVLPQVLQPYVMATGSMSNTLTPGDYFLVRPLAGSALLRGDVIQMHYPLDRKQVWIKRIVAVGGDRLHFRDKTLFVNGVAAQEPYVIHGTDYVDNFRDNFPAPSNTPLIDNWAEVLRQNTVSGEVVVPAGKYFVLGDNRDNSLDSRYFGFVDRPDIVGKPVATYFSVTPSAGSAPLLLHPSQIRWGRMFKAF